MAFTSLSEAKIKAPNNLRVDQLIESQSAYLAKNSKDWEATYHLAKMHYYAFTYNLPILAYYKNNNESNRLKGGQSIQGIAMFEYVEELVRKEMGLKKNPNKEDVVYQKFVDNRKAKLKVILKPNWTPPIKDSKKAFNHYLSAKDLFQKVIENQNNPSRATLGMALLLEQYAKPECQKQLASIKKRPQESTTEELINLYYKAFSLAKEADVERGVQPFFGLDTLVSYSAGVAYLRLDPKGEHADATQAHVDTLKTFPELQ